MEFDDDDDFGSFDEASIHEELDALAVVDRALASISTANAPKKRTAAKLQSESAAELYAHLSQPPRLQVPNWTRLRIRHSLLIRLGVPINLDELAAKPKEGFSTQLEWDSFDIPSFELLNLDAKSRAELLESTSTTLSKSEEYGMENTSRLHLENALDAAVEAKLAQMRENYSEMCRLGAVWQDQIRELEDSRDKYGDVVQNIVGYSQKQRRNEMMERIGKKHRRRFA